MPQPNGEEEGESNLLSACTSLQEIFILYLHFTLVSYLEHSALSTLKIKCEKRVTASPDVKVVTFSCILSEP